MRRLIMRAGVNWPFSPLLTHFPPSSQDLVASENLGKAAFPPHV